MLPDYKTKGSKQAVFFCGLSVLACFVCCGDVFCYRFYLLSINKYVFRLWACGCGLCCVGLVAFYMALYGLVAVGCGMCSGCVAVWLCVFSVGLWAVVCLPCVGW